MHKWIDGLMDRWMDGWIFMLIEISSAESRNKDEPIAYRNDSFDEKKRISSKNKRRDLKWTRLKS